MKNLFKNPFFKPALVILAALLALVASFNLGAQIYQSRPTPDQWVDRYGTNFFTLNQDVKPVVTLGTSVYTGATTNVSLYGGSTNQLRLQIVNGVVTGIVAY